MLVQIFLEIAYFPHQLWSFIHDKENQYVPSLIIAINEDFSLLVAYNLSKYALFCKVFMRAFCLICLNFFLLLFQFCSTFMYYCIVSKGSHTPSFLGQPPFSKIPPFLEIKDVPTFYRPTRKTKVLINWFIYNFYPQSILILEEYLQKWWNANYEKWVPVRQRNIKLLLKTVTYIICIITIEKVMCIMHCRK